MAMAASAASWDVAGFLEEHGLGFTAAAFQSEGFRTVGDLLDARLTDSDLRELGLVQMMPRKRLQNALADVVQADSASVGGSAPVSTPSLPAAENLSADTQSGKDLPGQEQERHGSPLEASETPLTAKQAQDARPQSKRGDVKVQLDVSPHREAWADEYNVLYM